MIWKLINIELPDSTSNELLSHGFMEFSCSPYDNCSSGTKIINKANISFDYEQPVITNVVLNTLANSENNNEILLLFPSPSQDDVYFDGIQQIDELIITGVFGRRIPFNSSFKDGFVKINANSVSSGTYFIKVIYENSKVGYGKFILFNH